MKAPVTRTRMDLESLLLILCGGAAAAYLLTFLAVALSRASYPFELEWMEGGTLQEVRRVLSGQPLYVAPTPEYVPFIYTPLYFSLGAVCSAFGGAFLPLRLLSLASALGCFVLIFLWIRKDTGKAALALLSAGLFAACYRPSGFWFDLARVDSLFLFLTLAGLACLAAAPRPALAAAAALCLAAAFQTKQTALPIVACMLPYVLARGRAYAATFLSVAALGIGGTAWLIDGGAGWYSYYVFRLPAGHPRLPGMLIGYWTRDLLAVFPVPLMLGAFALLRAPRRQAGLLPLFLFRLCATAGMIGAAWMSRLHDGGWNNVLMPAYAWLALLAGWGLAELRFPVGPRGALIGLALLVQFAWLRYHPFEQIPQAADAAAGAEVMRRIAAMPGEVYVPDHGYLAARAGKNPGAHRMAFEDVLRGKGGAPADSARVELHARVAAGKYSTLILNSSRWEDAAILPDDFGKYYALEDSLPLPGRLFMTMTGMKSRPAYIFKRMNAE
jgi:hypothetical protein